MVSNKAFPLLHDGEAWCFDNPGDIAFTLQEMPMVYACEQGLHVENLRFTDGGGGEPNQEPGEKRIALKTQGDWAGQNIELTLQQWDGETYIDRNQYPCPINSFGNALVKILIPITLKPFDIYRVKMVHPMGAELFSENHLFINCKYSQRF